MPGTICFRNITPDPTGISTWTYFGNMTDADLGVIYSYLQTIPAVQYNP